MADREIIGQGATKTILHTEMDGTLHIEEWQDVEPILDYAHAARNYRFNADALDGMMRHEAEIPFVVFQEACKRRGIPADIGSKEGEQVIEEILRDPAFAAFKTAPAMRDPRVIMKGSR